MSQDTVRAKWVGPMRDRAPKEADGEGNRPVVYQEPASWVQYRDEETGEVKNLPAGDITDDAWQALSPGERQSVRDSGLYEVETDTQASSRHRRARGGGASEDAAAAVKE